MVKAAKALWTTSGGGYKLVLAGLECVLRPFEDAPALFIAEYVKNKTEAEFLEKLLQPPASVDFGDIVSGCWYILVCGDPRLQPFATWYLAKMKAPTLPSWRLWYLMKHGSHTEFLRDVVRTFDCGSVVGLLLVLRSQPGARESRALQRLRFDVQQALDVAIRKYLQSHPMDPCVGEALRHISLANYVTILSRYLSSSNVGQAAWQIVGCLTWQCKKMLKNCVWSSSLTRLLEVLCSEPHPPPFSNCTHLSSTTWNLAVQDRVIEAVDTFITTLAGRSDIPNDLLKAILRLVESPLTSTATSLGSTTDKSASVAPQTVNQLLNDLNRVIRSVKLEENVMTQHLQDIEAELTSDGARLAIAAHQCLNAGRAGAAELRRSRAVTEAMNLADPSKLIISDSVPDTLNLIRALKKSFEAGSELRTSLRSLQRILTAPSWPTVCIKSSRFRDLWLGKTPEQNPAFQKLFNPLEARVGDFTPLRAPHAQQLRKEFFAALRASANVHYDLNFIHGPIVVPVWADSNKDATVTWDEIWPGSLVSEPKTKCSTATDEATLSA